MGTIALPDTCIRNTTAVTVALARNTILPAVSSPRAFAKESRASEAYVGFIGAEGPLRCQA